MRMMTVSMQAMPVMAAACIVMGVAVRRGGGETRRPRASTPGVPAPGHEDFRQPVSAAETDADSPRRDAEQCHEHEHEERHAVRVRRGGG